MTELQILKTAARNLLEQVNCKTTISFDGQKTGGHYLVSNTGYDEIFFKAKVKKLRKQFQKIYASTK